MMEERSHYYRSKKCQPSSFKAKVALEAIKGKKTVADLCQEYEPSSSQIFAWKEQFEEGSNNIFEDKKEMITKKK